MPPIQRASVYWRNNGKPWSLFPLLQERRRRHFLRALQLFTEIGAIWRHLGSSRVLPRCRAIPESTPSPLEAARVFSLGVVVPPPSVRAASTLLCVNSGNPPCSATFTTRAMFALHSPLSHFLKGAIRVLNRYDVTHVQRSRIFSGVKSLRSRTRLQLAAAQRAKGIKTETRSYALREEERKFCCCESDQQESICRKSAVPDAPTFYRTRWIRM